MHIHPYERAWIIASVVLLALLGGAIVYSSASMGIHLPGVEGTSHAHHAPAAAGAAPGGVEPGIRQVGPNEYEVTMLARVWNFTPNEIRVPQGAKVTFVIHSADIIHGIKILDTNVSMMVIPGQVGKATYTFTKPGEYLFVCHEYCGAGHHLMSGKVVVEGQAMN